jgi:hypothetical protein
MFHHKKLQENLRAFDQSLDMTRGYRLLGTRQPLKLSSVIPVVKVAENGRLEGARAATKAFSCHSSFEGCRKRKVRRNRQPLKLSPAIPVVKVVENGRFKAPGQPLKLSPVIPVVKVVQ